MFADEAHSIPEDPDHDLYLVEGSHMFAVCPPGGCTASLTDAQTSDFRTLHIGLTVLVRRYSPARNHLSANPLVLLWESEACESVFAAVLAFRTHVPDMDMIFFELCGDCGPGENPPFDLCFKEHALRAGAAKHWNDMAICCHLARQAQDWRPSQLLLGDIGRGAGVFHVIERKGFDSADLLADAEQLKEEQRALRAVKIAHGYGKKSKRRGGGRARGGRARGRGRRGRERGRGRVARNVGDVAAGEAVADGDGSNLDEEEGDDVGQEDGGEMSDDVIAEIDIDADEDDTWQLPPAAAVPGLVPAAAVPAVVPGPGVPGSVPPPVAVPGSGSAPAAAAPGEDPLDAAPPPPPVPAEAERRTNRTNQRRGVPWGPFILSPIVPKTGHSGWGAICGMHKDRGEGQNSLCKKAVSMGTTLSNADCILRLKRWLIAGMDDSEFPRHRMRSHHVSLGGVGLGAFAHGMSEEELDARVTQLGPRHG